MKSHRLLALTAVAIFLASCDKQRNASLVSRDSTSVRAKLAAHALNDLVGPVWPHDSTCFVLVDSSHYSRRASTDSAKGEAFARCVDSLELLARASQLT